MFLVTTSTEVARVVQHDLIAGPILACEEGMLSVDRSTATGLASPLLGRKRCAGMGRDGELERAFASASAHVSSGLAASAASAA